MTVYMSVTTAPVSAADGHGKDNYRNHDHHDYDKLDMTIKTTITMDTPTIHNRPQNVK